MIYFSTNGEIVGPFDEVQATDMIATGAVPIDSFYWREGMPDWLPVSGFGHEPHPPSAADGHADWSAQVSTASYSCRHDHIFTQLATCLREAEFQRPKVLSFGCGPGFEPLDLLRCVGDAAVFACDVSLRALKEASERCPSSGVDVFQSSPEEVATRAPFDAIVAMNVLTRYPEAADNADISGIYPFEQFAETLRFLVSCLSRGGFLAVYNASYLVEDAVAPSDLLPVAIADVPRNGWIPKFARDGKKLTDVRATYLGTEYANVREWRAVLNRLHPSDGLGERLPYQHIILRDGIAAPPDLKTVIWRRR